MRRAGRIRRGVPRSIAGGARIGAFALALTAMLAGGVAAEDPAPEDEGGRTELDRLRDAIVEARERVGTQEKQERAILERLEEIERSVERLVEAVAVAERDAKQKQAHLEAASQREARGIARLNRTREAMARRAVALYKSGELGPVRVLFSAQSMPELFSRVSMMEKVLESDAELVARHASELEEFESARRAARESARVHARALAEFESRNAALVEERAAKGTLLARVRRSRSAERAILIELEKASRALEETLATIGEAPRRSHAGRPGADFAKQKGALPWPATAKVRRRFGRVVDEDYLTQTFRNGIELDGSAGDPVRAVAFGEVRFAGWFRGYGKIVILDHGDEYFTVSGHLDRIAVDVGQLVSQGEEIGSIGETGSFSGPGLYFEVRRGRESMDPAEWLAD